MSFVKFTLGDIRSALYDKLDDTGFSTDTIDRAANDFQFDLFNQHRIRFMEKHQDLSVLSNASSVDLPDDFMTLINLTILDSATVFRDITKSGFVNYDDFMTRFGNYSAAPTSKIYNYTFYGEGLRFQSRTNGAYTAALDYLRAPVLMTDAASECELPINCRELMTLGTLERIMRINEDYNEADAELERLEPMITAFVRNYGRGSEKVGPQIMKTGMDRRRNGYRVDRDF